MTAGLLLRQQKNRQASGWQLHQQQALQYALGSEALAIQLLAADRREQSRRQPSVDHPGELWARQLQGRLHDLAGRFNLNSLSRDGQPDAQALARWQRLLQQLDITADGHALQGRLSAPGPQPVFQDVSQLQALLRLPPADWQRLQPLLSTLPADTPLNINSADPRVLASVGATLSAARARQLQNAGGRHGWRQLADFLNQPQLAGQGLEARLLAVGSSHFMLDTQVQLGDRRLRLLSQLQRSPSGRLHVLRRSLEPPATSTRSPESP